MYDYTVGPKPIDVAVPAVRQVFPPDNLNKPRMTILKNSEATRLIASIQFRIDNEGQYGWKPVFFR